MTTHTFECVLCKATWTGRFDDHDCPKTRCERCGAAENLDYVIVDGRDDAALFCDDCFDRIMESQNAPAVGE